jgi:hypothetical protein
MADVPRPWSALVMKTRELLTAITMPLGLLALVVALTTGCESKEKVLEIEGPRGGEVDVERDPETGDVDVDVNRGEDKVLDIDTPGANVEVTRDEDNGGVDVDVEE